MIASRADALSSCSGSFILTDRRVAPANALSLKETLIPRVGFGEAHKNSNGNVALGVVVSSIG